MQPIPEQTKKVNRDEPDIEGKKIYKSKKTQKNDLGKSRLVARATP